jgi:hypothetical protein
LAWTLVCAEQELVRVLPQSLPRINITTLQNAPSCAT